MGTWMSHLRIAEKLLDHMPDLDPTAFVLGNLSPDAGIPNADHSEFDPPKEVTHFLRKGEGESKIRDMLFYEQYLAVCDPQTDNTAYSFRLGYFFHLLCDNLWAKWLGGKVYRPLYPALFAEHGNQAWWIIKEDWYQLDLKFVRDQPDSLGWRLFQEADNPPAPLPFLSEQALHQQLDRIRNFYGTPHDDLDLDRVYPYLSEATMDRYVANATAALVTIHAALQADSQSMAGHHTALDLLPAADKAPYTPPLGDVVE